ncbi:helix-turn-helix transcriptional regulator [Mageeibacillus indolicus]|uniref:helix-turn-helix domain-containing protein n=1 Tax=Mageeibacillus indolicus TaxID=884684 RepID=UPI003119735B
MSYDRRRYFQLGLNENEQISANIITKLCTGQYISLEKVESICRALHCTPDDILEFIAEDEK